MPVATAQRWLSIGREAARRGPPRAQRPPGRAHGVYRRLVSRLVLVFRRDYHRRRHRPDIIDASFGRAGVAV